MNVGHESEQSESRINSNRNEQKVKLIYNLLQLSFNPKEVMASQYSVKSLLRKSSDSYPKITACYKHYFSAEFTLYSSAKDANQVCHYRQTLMALIIKFKQKNEEHIKNIISCNLVHLPKHQVISRKCVTSCLSRNSSSY